MKYHVAKPILGIVAALFLTACTGLRPAATEDIRTYLLDAQAESLAAAKTSPLTLVVGPTRAHAGFDDARMAYVRQPHALEYFARNQWADAPARMIGPLLVRALEKSGAYRAVVAASSGAAAKGNLRLDTELVRLQQEFTSRPSRVRLTIRAQLVDSTAREVVKTQVFEVVEDAAEDTPYGGVAAANRAMGRALGRIADFAATAPAGQQ